jgi:hypothetical protein
MDMNYNFFFIDSGIKPMVRVGRFSSEDGKLNFVRVLEGIPARKVSLFKQKVNGNMGVEVSADGSSLFFSRATWKLKGFKLGAIRGSDILFMKKINGKFVYSEEEAKNLLRHINTSDLEYAASISTDALELFFTGLGIADLKKRKIRSKIMHSTRKSLSDVFSKPTMIEAIGGSDFVEGPAVSGDGKELYYHKQDGRKFRLYKVTRCSFE